MGVGTYTFLNLNDANVTIVWTLYTLPIYFSKIWNVFLFLKLINISVRI